MRSKTLLIGVIGVVIGLLLAAAGIVVAGGLNPSVGPGALGSQMYTMEQIYQRLTTGAYFAKQSGFTEPSGGPTAGTGHTLDQIMAQAQPRALAKRVAKTGQTTCYDSGGGVIGCADTGQDGQYQMGIDPVVAPTGGTSGAYNTPAWTGVRFTDNGDGTVTDNLTALIWLKNANCTDTVGGVAKGSGYLSWANALTWSNSLASGSCGLSDASTAGQWRLPNVNELHSLGPTWPPGVPFTGVQSTFYWSSTSYAVFPPRAWLVDLYVGSVFADDKPRTYDVWPVRGGQ